MKETIDVNEKKIYFSLIKNENEGKKLAQRLNIKRDGDDDGGCDGGSDGGGLQISSSLTNKLTAENPKSVNYVQRTNPFVGNFFSGRWHLNMNSPG